MASESEPLDALLEHIRKNRGIDFANYKHSTLERRIGKRIQALGVDGYRGYLDYLQASPDEFVPLLDALFINVTGFFRDPEAWAVVRDEVVPRVAAGASADEPLRIWSAGVASGEEAYTIAMLLAEHMGDERFLETTRIFATDIDDDALMRARNASYSAQDLEQVPEELRAKYFEAAGARFLFRPDLRRAVIFGRHNVLDDAPISRLTLLVCRNTLMYFNREAQSRVLARFHFALKPDGYLFMGKAELLLTRRNLFQPTEGKARLFRKVTDVPYQERLAVLSQVGGEDVPQQLAGDTKMRDVAFDSSPVAEIIVDGTGNLALVNAAARALFRLGRSDLGRPFHELELSYKPAELRAPLDVARSERRPTEIDGVEWRAPDGRARTLDVRVQPLHEDGVLIAVKITFRDVTRLREMSAELTRSKHDVEAAYEELQSTNEELETTNEELQSTVEELETTNEELQSTNEELETMNEELQSTNTEISTINDELRDRTDELDRVGRYTRSVLDGLGMAVVVLDSDFRVRTWNKEAQELWGLRPDDVEGQLFLGLDMGLPVEALRDLLKQCQRREVDRAERVIPGHDRRGKPVSHQVTCIGLHDEAPGNSGVIVLAHADAVASG